MTSTPSAPPCPDCRGSLHIRTPTGWRRCDCIRAALNASYILPAVRDGETDVPDGPLLPLETGLHRGDWAKFRRAVWRTLLKHEPSGFTYDFVRADRLVDIQMEREAGLASGYDGVRALEEIDLLVMRITRLFSNRAFPPLFLRLVDERVRVRKPTWMFLDTTPNQFFAAFRVAGDDWVDDVRRWYDRQPVTEW